MRRAGTGMPDDDHAPSRIKRSIVPAEYVPRSSLATASLQVKRVTLRVLKSAHALSALACLGLTSRRPHQVISKSFCSARGSRVICPVMRSSLTCSLLMKSKR